ncbi:MAG: DUF5333 domain-containing protein [Loktanella sp.]|nr:DUF5333 domain-containing protein [Loktanella sp.]
MSKTPFVLAALLGVVLTAGNVSAQSALKDVPRVQEGIITIGMAYEITQKCGSIGPRYFRANAFLNDLKSFASREGFSDDQIQAYVDDKAEKDRLEAIARERLASMGAVAGRPDTYCAVGRSEIAANTPIGRLMR